MTTSKTRTTVKVGNMRRPKANETVVSMSFVVPNDNEQQQLFWTALVHFFLDSGQHEALAQVRDAIQGHFDSVTVNCALCGMPPDQHGPAPLMACLTGDAPEGQSYKRAGA